MSWTQTARADRLIDGQPTFMIALDSIHLAVKTFLVSAAQDAPIVYVGFDNPPRSTERRLLAVLFEKPVNLRCKLVASGFSYKWHQKQTKRSATDFRLASPMEDALVYHRKSQFIPAP